MDHPPAIVRLARAWGLQVGFHDFTGTFRDSREDSLRAVLAALGAAVEGDLEAAIREREEARARELLPPVLVAWDGWLDVQLRVPRERIDATLTLTLTLEHGEVRSLPLRASDAERARATDADTIAIAARWPTALPTGYHRLVVAGTDAAAVVLAAPRRVWQPPASPPPRHFGVFAPMFALHSEGSLGVGDFGDMARLYDVVAARGGSAVATLPLLSAYLDDPCEASPYVPCSRLAWNELYLDLRAIPELAHTPAAAAVLAHPDTTAEIHRLRGLDLVEHRAEMALRRRVLAPLAEALFADTGPRRDAFDAFVAARPELVDYARFRAAQERFGVAWDRWPETARAGVLPAPVDPVEQAAMRHHLFAQFCCHEQLTALSQHMSGGGLGLYLDLPVGVHGLGFDTWRHREVFVHGLATGAPPDLLFGGGQNWAFPPLHPDALRRSGHAYTIAMIRNHLRYAKALRIDHVMGLHRLYVIPQGARATEGVYLEYPHDEFYAIFSIESHRSGTLLVGEDLGTVPGEVHEAMREHGVLGMHVVEYAARPQPPALPRAGSDTAASVNTHDMPTFAAYWCGDDIDDRVALGWIDDATAAADHRARAALRGSLRAHWSERTPLAPDADADAAYDACLVDLGDSETPLALVALEDLWGELHPHNVPGTWLERPNWRRRARFGVDALPEAALAKLTRLAQARAGGVQAGAVRHDASRISADDLHWFNEGTHERVHDKLGAHPHCVDGVDGVAFAVWAPSAREVSVIGDWNAWRPGAHPLHVHGSSGIWEGFVPGVAPGCRYKFDIVGEHGHAEKADPVAAWAEAPPRTASLVARSSPSFDDEAWLERRAAANRLDAPMTIYECHLGSWMRVPEEGNRMLGYRELGVRLAEYLGRTGFTHVELLPVMEHPFYGSWGYQTTGYFAPTARHGSPADFRAMIDTLHAAGITVILDWVPSHFPSDAFALANFDGTHLYEHADPRKGYHPDWHSSIFNYGRYEVCSFLVSSALSWLERFGVDGLRVDAVASMLYLDYSRKAGEWVPNVHGGRENLEAIAFLRRLNEALFRRFPGAQSFAEESTAWPMVSRPTWLGGLGFGLKWDMGWMHDTLRYMGRDPIHRGWHQHELTFRMIYAFGENFVLPLSHDEVVHGKGSMLGKMPGDRWQKFANLRLLYGYMWGQPGKKLLFMGGEFAQEREWNHDLSLDWHLLGDGMHAGVQRWIADLNRLHRDQPALHEQDHDPAGFEWIDFTDATNSVFAWLRRSRSGQSVLVVCNFTPVPRPGYRIGVPHPGHWYELANSDAGEYGGSGLGNFGGRDAEPVGAHGRGWSLELTLPPLGCIMLRCGDPT
ncbi:MAG: 1,4-alpha-glucan branching protein GlgB [Deltaproteobacteria bacterium]|nr:1,4-alpha-glucan branching protein GlgB [Deltaproteobacteria bacterium]